MKEKNRNIIKILKVLPFFKELNEDEILMVLIACKKENMDSHSLLCYQGDISDKMFILTKGAVQISIDEIPIINVTKPSSFGECGAFTNERRNATIKVLDASEFCIMKS